MTFSDWLFEVRRVLKPYGVTETDLMKIERLADELGRAPSEHQDSYHRGYRRGREDEKAAKKAAKKAAA